MLRHQHITFNQTGQSLIWDAPEGRASSVTGVKVYMMSSGDNGTEEVATSGSSSIDSVSTTVNATSGAGQADPRKVNLTATTNIVEGRQYLLTDDDNGLSEWVHVLAIVSADYVIVRERLANTYSTGATFVGSRITISVDSTWVADQSNLSDDSDVLPGYRVRWTYVVGGVTRVHYSDFDLVRYPASHAVLPAQVDAMYPGFADRLPTYHRDDQGRRLIDEAYEQVRWDLIDAGLDDARIRSQDALSRATCLRFGVLLARAHMNQAAVEDALAEYDRFINKVFRSAPKVPASLDSSGAGVQSPGRRILGANSHGRRRRHRQPSSQEHPAAGGSDRDQQSAERLDRRRGRRDAPRDPGPPAAGVLVVASTAGSGTMTCTLRAWGYHHVAAVWVPLGIGTGAAKGLLNGGAAIDETGADTLRHSEPVDLPSLFSRVYLEITAIAGTATAVSAWLTVASEMA